MENKSANRPPQNPETKVPYAAMVEMRMNIPIEIVYIQKEELWTEN